MFKPLLAEKADLDAVRFPVLASPKLDGIRAMTGVLPGVICSRNLKPIPNAHVQDVMAGLPPKLDGELLTYTNGARDDFATVQSKLMSRDGAPEVVFHVFDCFEEPDLPFSERLDAVSFALRSDMPAVEVTHRLVTDAADLTGFEAAAVGAGWEGVMLRDPAGRYKFGRSTAKEGILLKVKRFEDDEATITGLIERQHNGNEMTRDALGPAKRSAHQAGMTGTGTLGAFEVEWRAVRFQIGTGMNDAQRAEFWAAGSALIGERATFKFQSIGSQGAPRFPVFLGIRRDL